MATSYDIVNIGRQLNSGDEHHCPLGGVCLEKKVFNRVVIRCGSEIFYIVAAEGNWKNRFYNHKLRMINGEYKKKVGSLSFHTIGKRRVKDNQSSQWSGKSTLQIMAIKVTST